MRRCLPLLLFLLLVPAVGLSAKEDKIEVFPACPKPRL